MHRIILGDSFPILLDFSCFLDFFLFFCIFFYEICLTVIMRVLGLDMIIAVPSEEIILVKFVCVVCTLSTMHGHIKSKQVVSIIRIETICGPPQLLLTVCHTGGGERC